MNLKIILEAGVNHNGSLDRAFAMIDAAAEAGGDMIKFQYFKAEHLLTTTAPKADYQKRTTAQTESQYSMIRSLELNLDQMQSLKARAEKAGLGFLVSPFDLQSLGELVDDLGLQSVKIASGELTNGPLLWEAGKRGLNVILSTGMANMGEITEALSVLAAGIQTGQTEATCPTRAFFKDQWKLTDAQTHLKDKVALLHCTTEYPCPPEAVNLSAMSALIEKFGLPTGYSDHTEGGNIALAAVGAGACIIEKHFTLDRNLPGPDHLASMEVRELRKWISSLREVARAVGLPTKSPATVELRNREIARKSLVAARKIEAGEVFTTENLTVKRPGTGLSPMFYGDLLGTRSKRNFTKDEPIE